MRANQSTPVEISRISRNDSEHQADNPRAGRGLLSLRDPHDEVIRAIH